MDSVRESHEAARLSSQSMLSGMRSAEKKSDAVRRYLAPRNQKLALVRRVRRGLVPFAHTSSEWPQTGERSA
jgi:hypothetical protein